MAGNMKRFNDGFDGNAKRSRLGPDDFEVRLLIPSRAPGSIIGKGGANIARLRTDYSAKVTIPDCAGPERVLTIVAGLDNAMSVVSEILPNLENSGGRGRRNEQYDDKVEHDLRVLVHQSQAGCIIGKGGSKVKELREKTGSRIKIFSECCPNSTDRVVKINGQGNTCVDCLKEILALIKEHAPIKGEFHPYNPADFDDYFSDEYGGYGEGTGGMGGPPMGGRGGGMSGGGGYRDGPPPRRGAPGGGLRGRHGGGRGGGSYRGGYGGDGGYMEDADYGDGYGDAGYGGGYGGDSRGHNRQGWM